MNTVPVSKAKSAKEQASLAAIHEEARRQRNIEHAKHIATKQAQLTADEQEARRLRHIEQAQLSARELEARQQRDIEEDGRRALLKKQRLQKEQELLQRGLKECPYCKSEIPVGAAKCKFCGEWVDESAKPSTQQPPSNTFVTEDGAYRQRLMLDNSAGRPRQTDVFAILCFASGLISLLLLPILFGPACYICGIVSYYRLKENRNLKGQGLRITGWIFGSISLLYLLWLYQNGPF
jgi:hypothetical protein